MLLFGFIIPYLLILFCDHLPVLQQLSAIVCLMTNFYFFIIELFQMKTDGFLAYIADKWNLAESFMFVAVNLQMLFVVFAPQQQIISEGFAVEHISF